MRTTQMITRRGALGLCGGALAATARARSAAADAAATADLAAAARKAGLTFGAAVDLEILKDADFAALIRTQCDLIVPSQSLKMATIEPQFDAFQFEPGDALVEFAHASGKLARGHTIVWNDYAPDWTKSLSNAELAKALDAYIDAVAAHFAGRLQSWDIVNEPFWLGGDRPGSFRPGPWLAAFGEDYIERAFRRVAALDPTTKLVLNEAWTEWNDPIGIAVRRALLALIERLQDKGVKLDAIGLQGHILPHKPWDAEAFGAFLNKIAARGLDIYITELDIDNSGFVGDIAARDREAAQRTFAFLSTALACPAVNTVICWGLADNYSWYNDPWFQKQRRAAREARPLPFDAALQPKPMFEAIARAFADRKL